MTKWQVETRDRETGKLLSLTPPLRLECALRLRDQTDTWEKLHGRKALLRRGSAGAPVGVDITARKGVT